MKLRAECANLRVAALAADEPRHERLAVAGDELSRQFNDVQIELGEPVRNVDGVNLLHSAARQRDVPMRRTLAIRSSTRASAPFLVGGGLDVARRALSGASSMTGLNMVAV